MYEEFYKEQLEAVLNYATYYKLSPREVYNLLANYGVKDGTKDLDRSDLKTRCAQYAEGLIDSYMRSGRPLSPRVEDQGHYFRHINVTFDQKRVRGSRDEIKLYIPIKSEYLEHGTHLIYDFLFQNGINFQSKISGTERAEMFVLRVNTTEEAQKVINFCSSQPTIYQNYTVTNPCVPHVNGVGIAKDTYNVSYNSFMSQCISEYANLSSSQNTQAHTSSFLNFLKQKYNGSTKSRDKYMSYNALQNMLAITGDSNILDSYDQKYNYSFDPNFFYSYKRYRNNQGYFYADQSGNIINEKTNPQLFIALQAQNCLHKMYTERYSTAQEKIAPKRSFTLNESEANKISTLLDSMMDSDERGNIRPVSIINTYTSPEVGMLYPYLFADFARVHKFANPEECRQIMNIVDQYQIGNNNIKR